MCRTFRGPLRRFAARPHRVATLSHETMDNRKKAATTEPSLETALLRHDNTHSVPRVPLLRPKFDEEISYVKVTWKREEEQAAGASWAFGFCFLTTIMPDVLSPWQQNHIVRPIECWQPQRRSSSKRSKVCVQDAVIGIPVPLFESRPGRVFPGSPQSLFSNPLRLTKPRSPKLPDTTSKWRCVSTFGKVNRRRSLICCVDFQLLATGVGSINWHTLAQWGGRKGQWTAFLLQRSITKHKNAMMLFCFTASDFLICGLCAARRPVVSTRSENKPSLCKCFHR
jgi:hypothetical protein